MNLSETISSASFSVPFTLLSSKFLKTKWVNGEQFEVIPVESVQFELKTGKSMTVFSSVLNDLPVFCFERAVSDSSMP